MNNNRILVFGALVGAATGLAAAYLMQRRAEETGTEISLTAGDGMKLGLLVMGLLRGRLAGGRGEAVKLIFKRTLGPYRSILSVRSIPIPIIWWELATYAQEKSVKSAYPPL